MILPLKNTTFEFIPLEFIDKNSEKSIWSNDEIKTVLMCDTKVNELYEIVMTTASGFYRYRLGDIIQVIDKMEDKIPIIKFLYRRGQRFNVCNEKLSDIVFNDTVIECTKNWLKNFKTENIDLNQLEYSIKCAGKNFSLINKNNFYFYYNIFIEFENEIDKELNGFIKLNLNELEKKIHENFCSKNEKYKSDISQPKINFIKKGTFQEIKNFKIKEGASENQLKDIIFIQPESFADKIIQKNILNLI
jgi:hypothetical protein